MFTELFKFELRYRMKLASTHVYFAALLLFSGYTAVASSGVIPGTRVYLGEFSGKLYLNSPFTVNYLVTTLCYLGLFVACAFMITGATRDFRHGSEALYFTRPITPAAFAGTRFFGNLIALLYIFSAVGLGGLAATLLPIYGPDKVGPYHVMTYLQPYLANVIPNAFFLGATFFCLAILLRRSIPVFTAGLGFLIIHVLARNLAGERGLATLLSLVDPLGFVAYSATTGTWTPHERNILQIPLDGLYLANRVLWVAFGLSLLVLAFARFRFSRRSGFQAGRESVRGADFPVGQESHLEVGTTARDFSRAAAGRLFLKAAIFDFWSILRSIYFHLILAGIGLSLIALTVVHTIRWGTASYPVTYSVLQFVENGFPLFVLVIVTIYAGELVWREREAGTQEVYDALPVPRWVPFLSKLAALMAVQAVVTGSMMVCGMVTQVIQGYYRFELALYAKELFVIKLTDYWILSVLAVVVHVVVNHKYLAIFALGLIYAAHANVSALGIEHKLFRFMSHPGYVYSDMNGYGHFVTGLFWFKLYWAAFVTLLGLLAYLFWVRGCDTSATTRLRLFAARMTSRVRALGLAVLLVFFGLGGWIYYNTNLLNRYLTAWEQAERAASYEKRYGGLRPEAQPKVTALRMQLEIYPSIRRLHATGHMVLKNQTGSSIHDLHVTVPSELRVVRLAPLSDYRAEGRDREHGVYSYRLSQPLTPGRETRLTFELESRHRGFQNGLGDLSVMHNGSFINSLHLLPHMGYAAFRELKEPGERLAHGLPGKGAGQGEGTTSLSDSDWIDFEAVVSTESDQIALAPGELKREWHSGGRRFFHYKTRQPVQKFFGFLSARYAVRKAQWRDVAIEVYHHPPHDRNVDRMILAVQKSLDYYTAAFGPYPYGSVRIAEFPRFARFAQYFPGLIPFSESAGFIAWVKPGSQDVDVPFAVTAHELAHEWFGHQVRCARGPGEQMLTETLANYSATMVIKKQFPERLVRKLLAYELEDYLWGRSSETDHEVPLVEASGHGYVAYQKGRLAMYALQEYIGEEEVNRALAGYVDAHRYAGPPHPSPKELVERLRTVTPPEYRYLVSDLFESVTLYDNKAVQAICRRQPSGMYEVTLDVQSCKVHARGDGQETKAPLEDWIEIGVQDAGGAWAYLQRAMVDRERTKFVVTLSSKPSRAGIDPHLKLIDRNPENNTIAVVMH